MTVAVALLGVVAYWRPSHCLIAAARTPDDHCFCVVARRKLRHRRFVAVVAAGTSAGADLRHQGNAAREHLRQSARYTLEFGLDKDLDEAAGAVQAAINAAQPWLPKNMPQPPTYAKANANGFPIIALALTSDAYDTAGEFRVCRHGGRAENIADRWRCRGFHRRRRQTRRSHPGQSPRGRGYGLVPRKSQNVPSIAATADMPKGEISDGSHAISLAANDQLYNASDYQDVVVAMKNGARVKLRDVAKVTTARSTGSRRLVQRRAARVMYVIKTPDANVVKTVDDMLAAVPQLERWIPPAIKVHVIYRPHPADPRRDSDVQFTMVVALVLVVLVIALFLRRLWATVIPASRYRSRSPRRWW